MKKSKAVVVANAALGTLMRVIGFAGAVLFFAVSISLAIEPDLWGAIVGFVFTAIAVAFFFRGVKIECMIKRFRTYILLISNQNMTLLSSLAAATNQTVDFVRSDLQKMINRKFFFDARIDDDALEIKIGGLRQAATEKSAQAAVNQTAQAQWETVKCAGCGATASKPSGGKGICEYCGSPI